MGSVPPLASKSWVDTAVRRPFVGEDSSLVDKLYKEIIHPWKLFGVERVKNDMKTAR